MINAIIGVAMMLGSIVAGPKPTSSSDKGISFFQGSFSEIKEEAEKRDQYIFMDCYAVWCGPCKSMARKVFTKKEVGEYFNSNFVNVKMDMERGEGPGLSKKYRITGYPTLLILDNEGNVVGRKLGYMNQDQLLEFAKKYTK